VVRRGRAQGRRAAGGPGVGRLIRVVAALLVLACTGNGTDTVTDDDVTCDHGDVNQDFGFLGVDVVTDNPSVHHLTLSAKLSASASVDVVCTLDSDPSEVHRASSDDELCHELDLYGLLGDRDYTCVLTSLTATEEVRVRTGTPPDTLPDVEVDEHDEDRRIGAYTLVTHLEKLAEPNQLKLLILDPEGRVRWSHFVTSGNSGDLCAGYLGDGRIFYGGAGGVVPTIVKLSGTTEWVGPSPSTAGKPHHHVELLDSGDVLMLSTLDNTDGLGDFTGFAVEQVDLYAGTVRWTVNSQLTLEAGQLGRTDEDRDPWHPNALVSISDENGDGVLVSLYGQREIVRMDPDTSMILWRLGRDGDFTLLDAAGDELDPSEWFRGTHAPELNGDTLLVYDNGTPTKGSRIVAYTLDIDARTAWESWSWTEEDWAEPIWGDVDDLGNDHLLITRGHCDGCAGVNTESRSEILELDRATEDVVWRVRFPHFDDGLYRAERIDGCALFANEKYCP